MFDYISREDYCEENCGKENREGYKTCTNCGMLNVPSADVQPVKCGNWKNHRYDKELGYWYAICSNCGYISSDSFAIVGSHRYCERCGARMDRDAIKEENEND